MLKILFFFFLFLLINSLKLIDITQNYTKSKFKNAFLKNGSEVFFANNADNMYKSSTLDGSKINSFSLNFSDNSSIIYVSELDAFIVGCTKDFFLAIIDSTSKIHIIIKENKFENLSIYDISVENKCNLLYYFIEEEDGKKNFNLLFSIPMKDFYNKEFNYKFFILNLNQYLNSETTELIEFKDPNLDKTEPKAIVNIDNKLEYLPYSVLIENNNNFFTSFLHINVSSCKPIYNIIFYSEKNISFNYNNKIEFIDIYPIGAFKYNDSGIFYGYNITKKNLFFSIPKFDNDTKNHTNINFTVEYDGKIINQKDYETIKAVYINQTHFILNYLYNENIIKIKIIDITNNEMGIGKKIFEFKLDLSNIKPIKSFFNLILSNYSFSYLLSTENEKYYFILTYNNCDNTCGICFETPKQEISNKCLKCSDDYPYKIFEELNNPEFECFDGCPVEYLIESEENDFICHSCLHNCVKCSKYFPFRKFEEINNLNFECYDECPKDYGYKIDKKEEYICYHKDTDVDGYYWNEDNFYPCPVNCTKCKNNEICLECSDDYPYKLFINNDLHCYDKCPKDYGYKIDKIEEHICYHKDTDVDGYYWTGNNFYPCPVNCTKCKNNETCLECSDDYPFRLFDELTNNEFKCFDKCPFGYKNDNNDYICYNDNFCTLKLNQIKDLIPNFITHYINQSIGCENYIIQCFYYNNENVEKFYKKNNLSAKIYLNMNNLRLLEEKKYIFFKLDIIREDELLNQVEYKLFDEDKNEINLNNTQIKISIPVSAKKNLNEQLIDEYKTFTNETIVWNSSSPFYNDFCYVFSEDKKDVILEDRKKNYFPHDKKILDENCEFVSIKDDVIDLICDYKPNLITENRNYTTNKIYEEFNIRRTNENFKILKCPKKKFYKSYIFWLCFILSLFQVIFFLYICKYVIFDGEEEKTNEDTNEKNDDLKKYDINVLKEFDLEKEEKNKQSKKSDSKDNNKKGISLILKKQFTLEGNKDDNDNDSNFIKNNNGKGISHFKINAGGGLNLKVDKNNNNIYQNGNNLIDSSNDEENHNSISENKDSNSNGLSLKIIDDSKNDNSELNLENSSEPNKIKDSNRAHSNFINDEEFKYMNFDEQINNGDENNEKNKDNSFFKIYLHYIKYNELTLYTFFKNDDFNHKYLKYSLFVFYLDCIILFNIFLFSNDIFSKIYNKNKYPFADCLGNNFIVILICYAISFGAKFFISTQHNIIYLIEKEKNKLEKSENNEKSNDEFQEVSNNFNNNNLYNYEKTIKNDKKRLINYEIKKKKCYVIAYFAAVITTYVYTFIHTISFGIIFNNTQKFIILNLFICYIVGIIFSLIFNLVSTLLRYFGVKKISQKLFKLSFWTTITIY